MHALIIRSLSIYAKIQYQYTLAQNIFMLILFGTIRRLFELFYYRPISHSRKKNM